METGTHLRGHGGIRLEQNGRVGREQRTIAQAAQVPGQLLQ